MHAVQGFRHVYLLLFRPRYIHTWLITVISVTVNPGGALPLEGGMGMCRGHDLLFSGQSALPSLPIYHQCAVHVCPPFQFLENFAFSALFWAKISALKTQNFWIFAPKTPQFSRKTRSLDPTFGNPCGTYPPKKNWVPPRAVNYPQGCQFSGFYLNSGFLFVQICTSLFIFSP